jgi:hypothetical protein
VREPREPSEDVDVIEMRIAVPKGVLTEADLPGLQKALLAAAQSYLQGRRVRDDPGDRSQG